MARTDIKRQVPYPSLSGRKNKDGTPRVYMVSVYKDGTAVCTCADFAIGTNRTKDALYRCKHVQMELESTGRTQKPTRPTVEREAPPRPSIDILGDIELAPKARRGGGR